MEYQHARPADNHRMMAHVATRRREWYMRGIWTGIDASDGLWYAWMSGAPHIVRYGATERDAIHNLFIRLNREY